MKKIARGRVLGSVAGIGLLLASSLLAGCLDINVDTRWQADGSGTQTIQVAIEKKYLALLNAAAQKQGRGTLEGELRKSVPQGGKLKRSESRGTVYYSTHLAFRDVGELRRQRIPQGALKVHGPRGPAPLGLRSRRIDFTADNGLFVSEFHFAESLEPGIRPSTVEERQLAEAFSMTYQLVMPGKIIRSNANQVTGARARWKLSPTSGSTVRATSRLVRWNVIYWFAGAAAAGLLLAAAALLALLRRLR